MKRQKLKMISLMLVCLGGFGCLFAAAAIADGELWGRGFFEREDEHSVPFLKTDNEGNETAGQIAAWLLLAANLPVAISILIKWANRFAPLGEKLKSSLAGFNRSQKKHLMFLHYYLNPAILGVAIWHYVSSRCVSTPLPEWGFLLMVTLSICGILIKFKLCPKTFRKNVYQIHTHPMIFIALILILTAGHLIAD